MASKLLERKHVSQTIVGKSAKSHAREEPRNNLLLQLGKIDTNKINRARVAKYSTTDARRRLDGDEI